MAKGKGKSTLLGIQGLVGHATAPDYGFLYKTTIVKSEKWNVGDRVVTPDGRVFRYAKAAGALNPQFGAQNNVGQLSIDGGGTKYAAEAGDTSVHITLDATLAGTDYFGTKDKMVGAYFSVPHGTHCVFRRIIAHDYSTTTGAVVELKLDAPLDQDLAITSWYEILPNPYGYLVNGGGTHVSVMGIPVVYIASGSYCWVQTWGPTWINVNSAGVGSGAYDRTVVFAEGGGIDQMAEGATVVQRQVAGFIIEKTTGGAWDNPPFVMLMISP